MRPATHVRVLAFAVVLWAAFWIAGWPDYYQSWPFAPLAVGSVVITLVSAWAGWRAIAKARPEHRLSRAFWLSFYFTVPLALLDTWYCGIHLDHGASFLTKYWYLSIFYVIPWLIWLPMGLFPAKPKQREV